MAEKREHCVKCLPPYFAAIRSGEKTFDVRRDDRGYQRGDFIVLQEFDPSRIQTPMCGRYTGEEERREITWILTGGQFGIEPGYVVLALKEISHER